MFVAKIWNGRVLFQTPYSQKYDLVQKLCGLEEMQIAHNNPVDFIEAGLVDREKWDCFHTDVPLALTTDEAPALTVNDVPIGANHGQPGAAMVSAPGHDKDDRDIGALYADEDGTKWTLLAVKHDFVTLMSENIGASYDDYAFKKRPSGTLTYIENGVHCSPIPTDGEVMENVWLQPVNRYLKRELYVAKDGKLSLYFQAGEYDYAEIHETYDIVHPVAMVESIRFARPAGGYTEPYYKAQGAPMIRVSGVYRIEGDGSITYHFTHKKERHVRFSVSRGAMAQEKIDAFGGGVYRYIPKLLPFETKEGTFDFSTPQSTAPGAYLKAYNVQKKDWENPDSPPDRMVDYFKDKNGNTCMGFAIGYLPVYDGEGKIRKEKLETAIHLRHTRKMYPAFLSGDIESAHGVAYKVYFPATDKGSLYTVRHSGKTYVYMDFFSENTFAVPAKGAIELLEKSETVSFTHKDGLLTVCAEKGYAVFCME